jgi:hypothetical protein
LTLQYKFCRPCTKQLLGRGWRLTELSTPREHVASPAALVAAAVGFAVTFTAGGAVAGALAMEHGGLTLLQLRFSKKTPMLQQLLVPPGNDLRQNTLEWASSAVSTLGCMRSIRCWMICVQRRYTRDNS